MHVHVHILCYSVAPPSLSFPDLVGKQNIVTLKRGSDHRMVLKVTSDPETDGNPLLSRRGELHREKKVFVDGGAVVFKKVKRSDAGVYTLSSSNAAGEGEISFLLKCESIFNTCKTKVFS